MIATTERYRWLTIADLKEAHRRFHPRDKTDVAGTAFRAHLMPMPSTSYRYLVNLPGVRSGRTIIERTRIGVHDVVALIVLGSSVDDVCRSFSGVTRAQVYECLAYYEDHRGEIDALVAEQIAPDEK
ncbi:MAG: DUF433 domain-containing protein [Opitutaceae bacterium]|nr:DUF433 domain-containing protein [Opitutaceae bacterium]